jgi:hypothetical protein
MRKMLFVLAGGVGAIALAGAAEAKNPNIHVMTFALPFGGAAQIEYVGDVAPQVTLSPAPLAGLAPSAFFAPDPFAAVDRIQARMDRVMDAMMRQAAAGEAQGLTQARLGAMPAGASSYSMVSTFTPSGVCTKTVEVTAPAHGGKPLVKTQTSGACGADGAPAHGPAAAPAAKGTAI